MEFAPSRDHPSFGVGDPAVFKRNIALSFFEKTLFNDPSGHEFAILAPHRRGVGAEFHLKGRLIDPESGQRIEFLRIADRIGDPDVGETRHDAEHLD